VFSKVRCERELTEKIFNKMGQQWRNTKIPRRPFTRYNPSIRQKISSTYSPWILLTGFLCLLIGIAIIACAIVLKVYDGDLKDELFHLWIGIPLAVFGLLSIVPFVTKKKKTLVLFLIIALIIMVVCATGAVVSGLRYWMDHWQQTKYDLDDDKCTLIDNKCSCPTVFSAMPASVDDCDDLDVMVKLVIAEVALCAGGFLASMMAVYISFMAICCAPWMYIEWYEEENDPDLGGGAEHVRTNERGNANSAYGM